jgi:dTDP-4-dehydrorhamnose 3,5-epimerase-like enzyme
MVLLRLGHCFPSRMLFGCWFFTGLISHVSKDSLVWWGNFPDNEPMRIVITELENKGDKRGVSFGVPEEALDFVGRVADLHVSSSVPGAVRGNHFHRSKRRAVLVLPGALWSLHWDEGAGTAVQQRNFDGTCAVLVLISPGMAHAVRNDGDAMLWLVAGSSEAYDPAEVVARKVV